MNLHRMTFFALLAVASATAPLSAGAADDDASRLEELKRAMEAPSGPPKGKRTRAIVFDGDASQAPQAAPPPVAVSGGGQDCASLPADVRATAVQFPIQFRPGSAVITPSSANTLGEISKILSLTPDRCVIVEGHTDAEGNADRNMSLSRDRANAVVKFIVDRGNVERRRLVPVGKGSTDPQKDLDPRDARNRRVVFKVVSG